MIETILEGNRRFRETEFTRNRDHYHTIARSQKPRALFICCVDSRIQTGSITQTRAGELFVMRNVGNIVPVNDAGIATLLEFAVTGLSVPDIVVCGHSGCVSIRALDREPGNAAIPRWLDHAREAKVRVDARTGPPGTPAEEEELYRLIEQENVRLQMEHLHTYPLLKQAIREDRVRISGLYYDLENGELSRVE